MLSKMKEHLRIFSFISEDIQVINPLKRKTFLFHFFLHMECSHIKEYKNKIKIFTSCWQKNFKTGIDSLQKYV